MLNLGELIRQAGEALDSGILRKDEESFVSSALMKFEHGARLQEFEITRLREIVDANR